MRTSDFIWQVLIILIFGAAGIAACKARTKNANNDPDEDYQPLLKTSPHLYLALPLLLILTFANVYVASHQTLMWNMPAWLQIHSAAVSWGIVSAIMGYVFGFCAVVALGTGHPLRWVPVCFGAAILAGIQVYAGWNARAELLNVGESRVSNEGIILQTTPYTCVPAAGANIAAILGIHTTEKQLVELCHTTCYGTFPAEALIGLQELGITGRKVSSNSDVTAIHAPAMLFVLNDTHAVVYAGMTHGLAEIWNYDGRKSFLSEERLRQMWDGHALEFSRAAN